MEGVELVIKVDKEIYESLKNGEVMISGLRSEKTLMSKILAAVANGTPLPKGSERLINADELARRIAGHSDYHGDDILSAIYCMAEGKHSDEPIKPLKKFEENMIQVNNLSVIHVS
jgi:hypothetical protein